MGTNKEFGLLKKKGPIILCIVLLSIQSPYTVQELSVTARSSEPMIDFAY